MNYGKGYILSVILQCCEACFAGSYADNVLNVINEDLTVADMACVQNLLSCVDNSVYRYLGYDDIHFDLRPQ